ncbi:protein THEMIS2 [Aythya fuligula]|uniref:Protein THEMIS2 n=1 Tax=Aythya fuligula TaxID=219594 RepID=A0A6J3E3X0_AYTFU|nr:protein THEMIS2 [Aythya fuligula]
MEPLSFQEYICSLDPTTLPRILRICSGVYFQGSVYEISGNECCLSTGDLLKITAVTLQKVVCENVHTGQTTELLPTFKGLFQPALDLVPYPTPQGPFLGVSGKKGLTLHQALEWRGRQTQPLRCPTIGPHALLLSPVYEVQATMNLRRDEVKIPSTLEVDVEDVTEESQDVHFSRPLLLSEVLGMEEVLPTQAEILEGPHSATIFESAWVSRLRKGQRLQIHSCSHTWRVLASARSGTRRFLLSSAYQGRFRRRPRQFAGVQELAASLQPGQQLHVVVMQDCEGHEDDVPPLSVGDRLEARQLLLADASTRLLCLRHSEEEGEEEGEELLLPLDLGGSFVEEVCDSKKYRLTELVELLPLPCDVRVVATDPALERDVLGSFPALRLEARITQPFLVSSFCEEPDKGFEIPPQWLDLSLVLTEEPVCSQAPSTHCSHVEELTEAFYYKLLAQLPGGSAPPPPRPPKPKVASRDVQVQPRPAPEQDRARSRGKRSQVPRPTTSSQTRLAQPLPPPLVLPQKVKSLTTHRSTPNEYSPRPRLPAAPRSRKVPSDTDMERSSDEHDYEVIEEDIQKTIKKMQTVFPF